MGHTVYLVTNRNNCKIRENPQIVIKRWPNLFWLGGSLLFYDMEDWIWNEFLQNIFHGPTHAQRKNFAANLMSREKLFRSQIDIMRMITMSIVVHCMH